MVGTFYFSVVQEDSSIIQFFTPAALVDYRAANNGGNTCTMLSDFRNSSFGVGNEFFPFEQVVRIITGD